MLDFKFFLAHLRVSRCDDNGDYVMQWIDNRHLTLSSSFLPFIRDTTSDSSIIAIAIHGYEGRRRADSGSTEQIHPISIDISREDSLISIPLSR
jgi:hypothetical protein